MAPLAKRKGPVWIGIRPVSMRTRARPPGVEKRDRIGVRFLVDGWWDRRFFAVAGR